MAKDSVVLFVINLAMISILFLFSYALSLYQVTKLPDESNETAVVVTVNLSPNKAYLKHMAGVVAIY